MDIKEKITEAIVCVLEKAQKEDVLGAATLPKIELSVPPRKELGDFATNFAMQAAKQFKQNPRIIAQFIKDNIEKNLFEKIEIEGPGFINFYLKSGSIYEVLDAIIKKGENYGTISSKKESRKILVEYVSANPTGPLHVGHGRGAAVGSALVNLLRAAGENVSSEYYINDAGNQIDNLAASVNARYLELLNIPCDFPDDGYHGQDIIDTAERIVKTDKDKYLSMPTNERLAIFKDLALKEKLAILKEDLEAFNVHFDTWFSEKTLHTENEIKKCCDDLLTRGFMYESEGALWLKSTEFGDDKDRVVIRENKVPTYLAADIAYHKNKFERGFDSLINLWGADHHGYIPRMKAACEALGYKGDQLEVLVLQMVSLMRDGEIVKMSKRTGQSITLNEVIEEVGTDAARFFFIMRSIDSHLEFDLNLAKEETKKNPVYYIQYAHARICSIFASLKESGIEIKSEYELSLLTHEKELELIKKICAYEEEVKLAAKNYAPHKIAHFTYELAVQFHSFYDACRILGVDENVQVARIYLVQAVRNCLKHALNILGVSAPEKM